MFESTEDKIQALRSHNIYRANHGCEPMLWSENLTKEATAWAQKLAQSNMVKHDYDTEHGENIVVMKGSKINGERATNAWYNEINHYDYDNPSFSPKTGHFTQLVWKDSKEFGYGEAVSANGTYYAVARYFPSGNVEEDYEFNVLPPVVSKILHCENIPENLTQEQYNVLLIVNRYRKLHSCEPLEWLNELNHKAEESAKQTNSIPISETMNFEEDEEYAVHSACGSCGSIQVEDVLSSWYEEKNDYNYNNPIFSESYKHFAQLVWHGTAYIGIAIVESPDDSRWCMTLIFHPKGNVPNKFKENVFPSKTDCQNEPVETVQEPIAKNDIILCEHNKYRALHGCAPLIWSKQLAQETKCYAEELLSKFCLQNDKTTRRGENIFFDWNDKSSPEKMMKKWYDQEKLYNYVDPSSSRKTKEFTQMVWQSTKYIGHSEAVSPDGFRFIVVRYWPPGNISGLYRENVKPKLFTVPNLPPIPNYYDKMILKYHNFYRKLHRIPKLTISTYLSIKAHEYAEFMLNLYKNKIFMGFSHTYHHNFSFICIQGNKLPDPKIVCKSWYNNGYYFEYDTEDVNVESATFTQMIWKSTTEIGVGAYCENGQIIIVVVYSPSGNIPRGFRANVKSPIEPYSELGDL